MKRIFLVLALSCAVFAAEEGPKTVQKIIQLKNTDAGSVNSLLQVFPVQVRFPGTASRTIAVSGSPEAIATVEEALKKLDVPPPAQKNIELTVYMITAGEDGGAPTKMPSELEPVVKQLRGLFPYPSYQLLESFQMRMREDSGAETSGIAPAPLQGQPYSTGPKTMYQCKIGQAHITAGDKGNVIRLDRVNLGLRIPMPTTMSSNSAQFTYNDVGVNTGIDVREGQKVVVGKANVTGAERSAFIFVVTAKVVD